MKSKVTLLLCAGAMAFALWTRPVSHTAYVNFTPSDGVAREVRPTFIDPMDAETSGPMTVSPEQLAALR